jgi:hypothetical protein
MENKLCGLEGNLRIMMDKSSYSYICTCLSSKSIPLCLSCICVLGVLILPVSAILDIGTVPTVWYFCYSFNT